MTFTMPAAEAVERISRIERLLASAREAIVEAATRGAGQDREELLSLRDLAREASEADLPSLLAQAQVLRQRLDAVRRQQFPDPEMPCFAHLRVRIGPRTRDVFVGYQAFVEPRLGVTIVDWRHSFATTLLLGIRPGDAFEEEWEGRLQEGVLEQRHLLGFKDGRLVRVEAPDAIFVRDAAGGWIVEEAAPPLHLVTSKEGDGKLLDAVRIGRPLTPVTALLDARQVEALQREARRPLLVLGCAGSGKTTVALHRVAMLAHRDAAFFQPERCLVIVPEQGLLRLTRILLRELGMSVVPVLTFDAWVSRVARRWIDGLPAREWREAPARVVRFKRHPALRAALGPWVLRRFVDAARKLDQALWCRGDLVRFLDEEATGTPAERLDQAESWLASHATPRSRDRVHRSFEEVRRGLPRVVDDLRTLLQDRGALEAAAASSRGDLGPADVNAVLDHSWLQASKPGDEAWAHVAPERRKTLDGRSLDSGTPDEVAGTIDIEDYALLLALRRLKTGAENPGQARPVSRRGRGSRVAGTRQISEPPAAESLVHHLVVDEAQDLALAELSALGSVVHPKGAITLAGDQAQQVDPTIQGSSWDQILDAIGARESGSVVLETSYRCPSPVGRFAWQVLGSQAPPEPPNCPRDGPPVLVTTHPHVGLAGLALAEALSALLHRQPEVTVAVLLRENASARRLHEVLSQAIPARLVLNGDFDFRPGVVVTTATQVKGLEFDCTVVADGNAMNWPDEARSRRLMHMAATRTVHQLWVQCPGGRATILPP
jgi:DNA helicase II / ATP-dependent DNA helicase PcrA